MTAKRVTKKKVAKKVAKKAAKRKTTKKSLRRSNSASTVPRSGEQFPDPDWATELLDGNPEKVHKILKAADELGGLWGQEATEDCRQVVGEMFGKAVLRKAERENPNWDGVTKIIPPKEEIAVATQELIAARRKARSAK